MMFVLRFATSQFSILCRILSFFIEHYRAFSCFFVHHSLHCIRRFGARTTWGPLARSEAEFEEIVGSLSELEVRFSFV